MEEEPIFCVHTCNMAKCSTESLEQHV